MGQKLTSPRKLRVNAAKMEGWGALQTHAGNRAR